LVHFNNSVPYTPDHYDNKVELIQAYRYCIAIENEFDTLMTDKILDCFLTGCIPIYKGTKRVRDYFDMHGVILFDTIDHLKQIIHTLRISGDWWYDRHINSVKENLEIAKTFVNLGDVLWTHGLGDVLKRRDVL